MLSPDNKIIHGMWVGTELSPLELLTLRSFAHHGHEFHLWAYDDLSAYEFPKGVRLRDAEEIIPRSGVFAKSGTDRETGVGRNSFGAPFSDLFRYKLLHEHGGIWADMDVTCLKPFDFEEDYAFRAHRIGIVGSILKCPKGSALMRDVYDETAACVNEDTEWLTPNRILTRHINEAGLEGRIVEGMSNPDNWMEFIRPLYERPIELPDEWFAIHWINEMWRTLVADNGFYRGTRLLDCVPDKNAPIPGSTMWELYRKFGLIDSRAPLNEAGPGGRFRPREKLGRPAASLALVPAKEPPRPPTHLNVLLPSLVRGGAERSVLESMAALRKAPGVTQKLFVIHRSRRQYPVTAGDNLHVSFGEHGAPIPGTLRGFALEMAKSPMPLVYTHLIPVEELRCLWNMGIATVPVVQNARAGWTDTPDAYAHPLVPFVVAVSDALADELREAGCPKPVVTIRHELQRSYAPEELGRHRRDVRNRYGIRDDTLVIGMVGQFKSQKAYTRAVRVLERVRNYLPAKLMILGGWDHEYGGGRAAYEATCRRAVEQGVIADMIMPGDVHPIDPYLAAFDIFLNTSVFEGLSVALLEAIAAGLPVVTADAGGNREVLPRNGALVKDGADIDAYVEAILKLAAGSERIVPRLPPEPTLVPRLWTMLAKHGATNSLARLGAPAGTLFVSQNLSIGGAQKSLVNLLSILAANHKSHLCLLEGQPAAGYKARLDDAQVQIFSATEPAGIAEKAEAVLNWVDALNVRNVCFWNAAPEFKLLIAKILSMRDIRLIDVSPGPMLFDELAAADAFQKRIAFSEPQYFDRLDHFVGKYRDGLPLPELCPDRDKLEVIANGVARAPNFVALPPPEFLLPAHLDPALAVGTCCRIVADKRVEFLLEAMQALSATTPGVSLTVVGGPDVLSVDYFTEVRGRARDEGLENKFFLGEHEDVLPFLGQFRVFAMVSDREGCPNASLEAMSMGLPVVARKSAATAEQIEDGVNGFLVSTPSEMAERIARLLNDGRLRAKMSRTARATALKRFSLAKMAERYRRLLEETD
jgi:glycosyltransferase involved in cell wall biosynthesis